MRKDLALALECADQVNAKTTFANSSLEYYRALEKKGYGGKDFGYVYQYINKDFQI